MTCFWGQRLVRDERGVPLVSDEKADLINPSVMVERASVGHEATIWLIIQ
ncbi:MAG: hypothetical protein IH855_09100 [Bacteroidetes bacterium]|nr:hypothetical protein [Bacteroidota bacterium]